MGRPAKLRRLQPRRLSAYEHPRGSCDNGSYRVSGVIDFGRSGWCPEYWNVSRQQTAYPPCHQTTTGLHGSQIAYHHGNSRYHGCLIVFGTHTLLDPTVLNKRPEMLSKTKETEISSVIGKYLGYVLDKVNICRFVTGNVKGESFENNWTGLCCSYSTFILGCFVNVSIHGEERTTGLTK